MSLSRFNKVPSAQMLAKMALDNQFYSNGPLTSTFVVDIDGDPIGRFSEVNGLELSVEVEEIVEGGQNDFVHKVPGRIKWPNITLKRGVTQSDNLMEWIRKSAGEDFEGANHTLTRSTLGITMLSSGGWPLRSWSVEGAFPVSWKGPTFSAKDDDALTEELEIAHHGFRPETFT